MTRRLIVPAAAIAVHLACQPPVDSSTSPRVSITSPDDELRVNEGATVSVKASVRDEDGDAPIEVRLLVDGVEVATTTLEASEGTVELVTPALERGLRTLAVTADDGDSEPREASLQLYVNGRPNTVAVGFTPANPTPDDDVSAALTTQPSDPDGDPLGTTWAWKRGGTSVLTGSTFPALLPASLTERGDTWTLEVEVWESLLGERNPDGLASVTSVDITITNDPPGAPTVTLLPTVPHPLTPLRCAATGAIDPQGAAVSYAWSWSRDRGSGFVDQPGITGPTVSADLTRPGDVWRCSVTATDGDAFGPAGAAEVTVVADLTAIDTISLEVPSAWPDRTAPLAVDTDGQPGTDLLLSGVASADDGAGRVDGLTPASLLAWSVGGYDLGEVQLIPIVGTGVGAALALQPDLSGDGTADLAITDSAGGVWLLRAEALPAVGGLDLSAHALQVLGAAGWTTAVGAGDAFGGGGAELFVPWQPGVISVFPHDALTFPGLLDAPAEASAVPDDAATTWGQSFAVGDLNADGTADLAVGVPREGDDRRCAAVFSGGVFSTAEAIPEMDALVNLSADPGQGCGEVVTLLPDLDGDGDQELAIGLPRWQTDTGRVAIFAGGTRVQVDLDLDAGDATLIVEGLNTNDLFGGILRPVGDLDGDGRQELAIGAPEVRARLGRFYLFSSRTLSDAMSTATPGAPAVLRGTEGDWRIDGNGSEALADIAGVGDVDGDGFGDLVVHGAAGTSWYLVTAR